MTFQIVSFLLLLVIIFIILGSIGYLLYSQEKSRPIGKLQEYKTRYTPNQNIPAEVLEQLIKEFEQAWCKAYGPNPKEIRRILNRLNIVIEANRWRKVKKIKGKRSTSITTAELTHAYTIKIWQGSKTNNNAIFVVCLFYALTHCILYNTIPDHSYDINLYKQFILKLYEKISKGSG